MLMIHIVVGVLILVEFYIIRILIFLVSAMISKKDKSLLLVIWYNTWLYIEVSNNKVYTRLIY